MKELTPFVSVEQQEANVRKLEVWRTQLYQLAIDREEWCKPVQGNRRAIRAMLTCLDIIIGAFADQFYVQGDAAVLNMPATLKLESARVPGQRMSILGRLREAARLGLIELWTEEGGGFKGEKIVIPLDTGVCEFYYLSAQGARYEGVTAHSKRGNQGQDLLRNLPTKRTTRQVGYATKSGARKLVDQCHARPYMQIGLSPDGLTKSELAVKMGVNRSTAGRIVSDLLEAGLIHSAGKKFLPLLPPCQLFLWRQKNIDVDKQTRSRLRKLMVRSLKFHEEQAERLRAMFKPTQKEVVKNARAIRALQGMIAAEQAGEAGSRFVNRRYV